MLWLVQKYWDSQLCTLNFLRHIHQKSILHWLYSALHRLSTFCFYNSQRHFQVLVVLENHLAANLIGMMKNQENIAANMVNINHSALIYNQKYSRLRCLLHVKGLVICFYLGWSGSTLLITKHITKVGSKS